MQTDELFRNVPANIHELRLALAGWQASRSLKHMLNQVYESKSKHAYPDRSDTVAKASTMTDQIDDIALRN